MHNASFLKDHVRQLEDQLLKTVKASYAVAVRNGSTLSFYEFMQEVWPNSPHLKNRDRGFSAFEIAAMGNPGLTPENWLASLRAPVELPPTVVPIPKSEHPLNHGNMEWNADRHCWADVESAPVLPASILPAIHFPNAETE